MKTIFALAAAVLMGSITINTANAQGAGNTANYRHMVEFSADDLVQTTLAFNRSKDANAQADNDTQLRLNLNYAYAIPAHRRLQVGGKFNYLKQTLPGPGDSENYGAKVGGYYNISGWNRTDEVDLMNSAYISAFIGFGWNNSYGNARVKDELTNAEMAIGKRMDLTRWGVGHVTYSPEVAFTTINSSTSASIDYTQSIELRLLQFSVLW
ncbi:MAG TPA: hypothetical protein VNJ08_05610 [Bacteriovoracaceae bacterium]|nr:hypothetical protein [Bacteriovoracaceae bacterium]